MASDQRSTTPSPAPRSAATQWRRLLAGVALAFTPLGLSVAAFAALGLFLLQNLQHVPIHFLVFDWHPRLIWALLASVLVGGLAVFLAMTVRVQVRRRHEEEAKG